MAAATVVALTTASSVLLAAAISRPARPAGASSRDDSRAAPRIEHSAEGRAGPSAAHRGSRRATHGAEQPGVLVLASTVRDSINAIFLRFNKHWNELAETNTLTQMLGTGPPTQREYLGCLVGRTSADTVFVTAWAPPRDLKQFQFAVTGSCEHVARLVGTWHTHPYRAGPDGHALKENALSAQDLRTFVAGRDRVVIAAWDVDSVDAAVRADDGAVHHPASVVVR